MSKIRNIQSQLGKFDLRKETSDNIIKNEELFVEVNQEQMRHGEDGEGPMRNYRSLAYSEYKRALPTYKAPYPVIDLFDTGAFQGAMFARVAGTRVVFSSSDAKRKKIVTREGLGIFDLNPKYLTVAQEVNEKLLAKKIGKIFSDA